MAHVHCPKCGRRLNLPPIQETRGVRCGVGSKFMDRKGGIMNEMCLVSRVPHRFGRIVPAGLLICFTMLARVSSTLADEISPPTTQPAMSLSAQKLFAQASPAVVKIHTYNAGGRPLGQGSGFLIDAAGNKLRSLGGNTTGLGTPPNGGEGPLDHSVTGGGQKGAP